MSQGRFSFGHELVIDLFAGGGGASLGMEWGMGRPVNIAINHDPVAIAIHQINHPNTKHFCESVFSVNLIDVTGNRPVGLLWASPDCTHHSKAKGGKPVSSKRRGLAWVVVKWARRVRPRVIMLENVEEFEDWGPLTADGKPCPVRKGWTFQRWVEQLERIGYVVDWRQLRACDYGAPTIRRRLFVIARRDGLPIVWPSPTHGDPNSDAVKRGKLLPWRPAAECIDWTIPCPSIFGRKRPLAENTLKRIARGIRRFVIESAHPFIVPVTHTGDARAHDINEPLRTVTCANGSEFALAVPFVSTYYGPKRETDVRGSALSVPIATQTTENRHAIVSAFLAKHYGDRGQRPGSGMDEPISTITAVDHHAVVAAHLMNLKGTTRRHQPLDAPAPAICAGGTHASLVAALMAPYYGSGSGETGRDLHDPAPTVTTKDRLQLITVNIEGEPHYIADIGMRMLQPRELFRAQGFPDTYIIDQGADGKPLSKAAQVRLCGNSVPPVWPSALIEANFPGALRQENAA